MTNGKPKQQQPAIDIKVETAAPKPARKPRQPRANPKARVHTQAPPATGNGANYADGRNARRGTNNQFRKLAANPAGSSKLSNFAASLVWPAQVPGVRYANVASTVPTALGSPWTQIPAPWSESSDPEELSFQAFRSLLRAYSIDYPTNTKPYLYNVLLTNNDRNSKAPPTPSARITIKGEETEDLHSPVAICASDFKPHGTKVFGGYPGPASRGVRFMWLETSTIVTATLNMETAGVAQDFSFNTLYWSLEDGFETGQNSIFTLTQNVPVTQNITIDSAGWYGFTISNQNPGDRLVDVSISFAGTIRVKGQNACPQLEGRESEIASYRIIGVAQMYENNAAPGARAGSIANYQVPANQDPQDFVTYQQVSGANGAFSEENKDGGYRWLKPTSEALDFSPRDEMVVADGIIYDSHWDLRLPNEFLVQTVSCPAPTGSGNPKSGIWWFYMGLEYESQSTWPQKAYASRNVRQYEDAMLSLQDIPGGCTNKNHTNLLKGFKKALNITEKALNVGKFIAAM